MTSMSFVHLDIFFLYFIAFATAVSPNNPSAPQSLPAPQSWKVVRAGRYHIVGCSRTDSSTLKHLLDSLYAALQPAIRDADQALFSPSPPFSTFFHSPLLAATQVSKLLTDVSFGRSAYPPSPAYMRGGEEDGHGLNPLRSGAPTFVCLSEPGWSFGGDNPGLDGYKLCQENPALVMDHFSGTQYINVCPQFFTVGLPALPPKKHCLGVNRIRNWFRGSGAVLSHFQVWVLLEEITGYYLGKGEGVSGSGYSPGRGEGVSDVNKCVALGARKALKNSMNYVYYVASIYGQCTNFPDLSEQERILLASNTTLLDT